MLCEMLLPEVILLLAADRRKSKKVLACRTLHRGDQPESPSCVARRGPVLSLARSRQKLTPVFLCRCELLCGSCWSAGSDEVHRGPVPAAAARSESRWVADNLTWSYFFHGFIYLFIYSCSRFFFYWTGNAAVIAWYNIYMYTDTDTDTPY